MGRTRIISIYLHIWGACWSLLLDSSPHMASIATTQRIAWQTNSTKPLPQRLKKKKRKPASFHLHSQKFSKLFRLFGCCIMFALLCNEKSVQTEGIECCVHALVYVYIYKSRNILDGYIKIQDNVVESRTTSMIFGLRF